MVCVWALQELSSPGADAHRHVRRFAALVLGFVVCLWVLPSLAQADVRNVLILYPYDNFQASSNLSGVAARRRLVELSGGKINFHNEFLDLRNFPSRAAQDRMAEHVIEKYAGQKIDLVLAVSEESYFFIADYGSRFVPDVPVVFCCTPDEMLTIEHHERPNVTGVVLDFDVERTLDLARLLQPGLRSVYVVGGKGDIDVAMNDVFRKKLANYSPEVEITFLEGVPTAELTKKISTLPPDAALLYSLFLVDGDGKTHSSSFEYTELLARAASVPAYGTFAPYLERGIVGGYIGTFEDAGKEMADLAWEILQGAEPAKIPVRLSTAQKFRVDEAAAERFGLDTGAIPKDAIVINHTPSLWEQHRALVIVAASVIAVQATLILALMLQTARRRRAEENARVAHAELAHVSRVTTMGELTASIAHEVNQPLAAIVANGNAAMRWLGHATPDLAEARAALTRIVQDGLRAADVISAIRGMVRRGEPASQALDMGALVREVLGLLRTEIESNGVTLARDIDEDLPKVRGDRVQLQQVVLNLVMNAIEAMAGQPAGERRLRVDVTRSGTDHIAVGVSDTGPGIPPEVAARVFEPFYTTKNHGMGMGLSICRTIVEAHGGKLTLQPDSPHGTTFIVTLQTEGRLS
jgi:signal transduction histidine kinase